VQARNPDPSGRLPQNFPLRIPRRAYRENEERKKNPKIRKKKTKNK
jgi:hypothetical protein